MSAAPACAWAAASISRGFLDGSQDSGCVLHRPMCVDTLAFKVLTQGRHFGRCRCDAEQNAITRRPGQDCFFSVGAARARPRPHARTSPKHQPTDDRVDLDTAHGGQRRAGFRGCRLHVGYLSCCCSKYARRSGRFRSSQQQVNSFHQIDASSTTGTARPLGFLPKLRPSEHEF